MNQRALTLAALHELDDQPVTAVFLRDVLLVIGGALQAAYFACSHGNALGVGDPCDLAPWQFGMVSGQPAPDPKQWIESPKSLLWREMNAAHLRIAHAIGKPALADFISATDPMSGYPILGAKAALTQASRLVGSFHYHRDQDPAKRTAVFGPSGLLDWLGPPPSFVGLSTKAALAALAGGAAVGARISIAATGDDR